MRHKLNPAQLGAVQSDHNRIVTLASPGTGKTRVVIARIERLVNDGLPAREIAAISFTNAAAREMQDRLENIRLGFCGTLHSFSLRLIQSHWMTLGYPSSRLAVLDETQAEELMDKCAVEVGYKGPRKNIVEALHRMVRPAKANLGELAAARFRRQMVLLGIISYDLILSECLRLLSLGITLPYSHLFVDEVQDSSDMDFAIYEALPAANKFFVGDEDQSIFAFRGANPKNFARLSSSVKSEPHVLIQNYRSDTAICGAANRLIAHNQGRFPKSIAPVSTAEGSVTVESFKLPMIEQSTIARRISEQPESTAVLLRTNLLVDQWKAALVGFGVKVASKETRQIPPDFALLKTALAVLIDPSNDWVCYQLLKLKIGEAEALKAQREAQAQGVTLNELRLNTPSGLETRAYRSFLEKAGLSGESLQLFDTAIAQNPPTGTDLLALLVAEPEEEFSGGVVVTTYHGAKGREWDNVYLPAFEQQLIPGESKSRTVEEERRLAFVGMTRARHQLFISFCEQRAPDYGNQKPREVRPSQFLAEAIGSTAT